jgi:gas vesicle protein
MAVGDTLLFTLRGAIGETDVRITATEPKFDGASVTISPEVEVSEASGAGPGVNIRFFRQNADGSFTALYSLKEFPGRTFTPDIGFTEDLQRDQFTIGFTVAILEDDLADVPDPGSTLTVPSPVTEPDPEPIPPAEGEGQFNVVLPSLPLIGNDPRILASLTIPQIPSIESAVADTVPSAEEIRGEVDSAIEGPLQRTEDRLEDKIETAVGTIDVPELPDVPETGDIVVEVEDTILDPIQSQLDTITAELTALDVPTADDISDAVDEVLDDLEDRVGQLGDDIESEFNDIEQDVDDLTTELSDQIETEIDNVESTVRTRLQNLQEEVAEDVGEITTAIDDLRGRLTEDIDQLGTDITSGLDEAQTAIETTIDQTVDSAVSTIDSSLDTVQSELQSTIDGLQDEVTGLIADLTEDVDGLITDVTQVGEDLTGLIEDIPDIVEDGATRALEEIEPELNDSGLFTDPVGFAVGFVQAASDEIVDPEVSQDLQETLDNR